MKVTCNQTDCFGNTCGECTALKTTRFSGSCPFYKDAEQAEKEYSKYFGGSYKAFVTVKFEEDYERLQSI